MCLRDGVRHQAAVKTAFKYLAGQVFELYFPIVAHSSRRPDELRYGVTTSILLAGVDDGSQTSQTQMKKRYNRYA